MSITAVQQDTAKLCAEIKGKNPRNLSLAERDSITRTARAIEGAIMQLPHREDRETLQIKLLNATWRYRTDMLLAPGRHF